jgi:ABC-type transport system involved in multi-copper enzyme maturation permease subunit
VINLFPAELRRQTGRRGSFFGSMGFTMLFAIALLIWTLTTSSDPSPTDVIVNGKGLVGAITVICSIIIGALAGAYDTDQGTMRYLVLTGRPRWQLVFVRYLTLVATVVLFTLPSIILILLTQFLANGTGGSVDANGWPPVLDMFWSIWLGGVLYGFLALSIGTLLKSNGVAIAVAIALNFAGVLAAGLLWEYVSHTLGNIFYPVVVATVIDRHASSAGPDPTSAPIGVGASVIVLAIWLITLGGVAWYRVQRAEY